MGCSRQGGAAGGRLAFAECSWPALPLPGESPPLLLGLPSPLLPRLAAAPATCGDTLPPLAVPAAPGAAATGCPAVPLAGAPPNAEEAAAAAATAAGPAGSSPLDPAPVWRGVPQGWVLYTMRCSAVSSMMLGMKQGNAFSPATDTPMAAARSRTCRAAAAAASSWGWPDGHGAGAGRRRLLRA